MSLFTQSISPISTNASFATEMQMASLGGMTNVTAATEAIKTDGLGFNEVMSNIAVNTVGKLQYAEQVSLDAVQGTANTREVVDALMSAEQSLQTAIAIRDKIVTAYLDVSRMQI